jgi:hypothetical protein
MTRKFPCFSRKQIIIWMMLNNDIANAWSSKRVGFKFTNGKKNMYETKF